MIALIKKCWQDLDVHLDFANIQALINARFSELMVYMDTSSPHFLFDKNHILHTVNAWFHYECQRYDPQIRITHTNPPLTLNASFTIDVDRVEHLPSGTKRYVFYTVSCGGLSFIRQITELQQYEIALAYLDDRYCRIMTLKPLEPQISLERLEMKLENPKRCLSCYLQKIMPQK